MSGKRKDWLPFEEAREAVRKEGLKNCIEYRVFRKKHALVLPSRPEVVYCDQWISWYDWLGTRRTTTNRKQFLLFEEAREIVRKEKLKDAREYNCFIKKQAFNLPMPSHPEKVYKQQWISWYDWLGNEFLSFEEARNIVLKDAKKYGINGWDDWQDDYVKNNKIPTNIPRQPHLVYKTSGWKSWGHWLGTNRVANKNKVFLPYSDALKIVRKDAKKYNITRNTWNEYCKTKKPHNIPSNPYDVYKNKGWVSFGEWLGTNNIYNGFKEFLPFSDAFDLIKEDIKKYNIRNRKDWFSKYCSAGKKPSNIPFDPDWVYREKGWISWGHWLRTNNIRGGQREYRVNQNFFGKWSPDIAYVLGFWFADGNMSSAKGRYNFSICQNKKDKYLLKKILRKMGSNHLLYFPKGYKSSNKLKRRTDCFFSISSKIIYNDILRIGGVPKKSLIIDFPKIPKEYMSDFIRGNFDGDGSISLNSKYSAGCYFCSGSKKFLEKLQKNLYDIWGINSGLSVDSRLSGKSCYRLSLGIEDIVKLYKIMYFSHKHNSLFLKRKHDKFNELIRYRKQKYGNKYGKRYGREHRN
jgi:hypothetical protein